jgi:hypothetical protein
MSRPLLIAALVSVLVPGLAAAQQTTVYKSKNADGTSVYTQIEAPGAQSQKVGSADPNAPAEAKAEEKPKTQTQIACEQASANLVLLDSGRLLQRDRDGDGKPEDLTPEELASERDLANRQVKAYCAAPPAEG